MLASEHWQHKEIVGGGGIRFFTTSKLYIIMAKVALILGCNIPYTFKFGYIIPNKFECSIFLYPPCIGAVLGLPISDKSLSVAE